MDSKLSKQEQLDLNKRISFDREQRAEITNTTEQTIYDKERLITGWERVYTGSSIRDITSAPTKFRFGTGNEKNHKWHVEEPSPAVDTVYTVCQEFHCREQDQGMFGVFGAHQSDIIVVVWHGYDKRIRER